MAPCLPTGGLQGGAQELQGPGVRSRPQRRSCPPASLCGRSPARAGAAPPARPRCPAGSPPAAGRAHTCAEPNNGSWPARAPRRHAWRQGKGGETGREGRGAERQAPSAQQLCPPREGCGRHPPGLAGACALLFLLLPPPRGGFRLSSFLREGGDSLKEKKNREKKSQVASPTSPGPAAAAAAPHSWHSWAVTPRAAPARPRPRRLRLARPPAGPTRPRGTPVPSLPSCLPPSRTPRAAAGAQGAPAPSAAATGGPSSRPPRRSSPRWPGRGGGSGSLSLPARFGSRRQPLPPGPGQPPPGPGQAPPAGAHKAGAAALPGRPPSR